MAMELENLNGNDSNETRDTLFLLGGAAFVVFGAGLILSTPMVRKALGGAGIGSLLGGAMPDLQKYLKLRDM